MADVQSAEQAVLFWGLTARDIIMVLGIVVAAGVTVFLFFLKPVYDRYLKARELSDEELEKINQGTISDYVKNLSKDERTDFRQAFALHQEIEQIKGLELSKRYTQALDGLLDWFKRLFKEPLLENSPLNRIEKLFGAKVFTPKSYVFCLTLAFFYPLLFMLLSWQFNGELSIAGHPFIGYMAVELRVLALLLIIPSFGLFYWGGTQKGKVRLLYLLAGLLCLVGLMLVLKNGGAVAVAVAVAAVAAVAGAVAVAGAAVAGAAVAAVAGTVTGTVAGTVAVAVAGTVAVAGALALAVGLAAAVFVMQYLFNKLSTQDWWGWLTLNIAFVLFNLGSIFVIFLFGDKERLALVLIPLFFGILPFTNALLDWLSINVTRGLLIRIRKRHSHWIEATSLIVIDIVLAAVFIFAVTGLTVTVVALVNQAVFAGSGNVAFDFTDLMTKLKSSEHLAEVGWVHAMVFSTIVPTLVHLLFALSALGLVFKTGGAKRHLAAFWHDERARVGVFRYKVFSGALTLAMFAAIVVGLGWALMHWPKVMEPLWDWADWILKGVDPVYGNRP